MFKLFNKYYLLVVLSLGTMNFSLMAGECCYSCESNRTYIGGFGGGMHSNSARASQMGTALFPDAAGGPLAVDARGNTNATWSGFGGVQIGYEWTTCLQNIGCSCWGLSPAVELEGYWYSRSIKGHLFNTTDTDRLPEHDFLDTFCMNAGVYLANAVFSLNNSRFRALSPYVGLGIGATRISLNNANSLQLAPAEVGINHFNSRRNDSSWAFAAQVKAGLRYNFCGCFHVFGEYRYLFEDFSNYIFGSTVYSTHVPTTPWNVKVNNMQYNAFVLGIQYDL